MFLIYGSHKKQHFLRTNQEHCVTCGGPTNHGFVLIKRAAHFFWIPIFALGSTLYMKCGHCGGESKVSNAPTDFSFWGYFCGALFFYSGNFFGYYYNVCTITILLSFVGIGISTIYLFTIPSAYSHMYVPEQEKEVSTATQPSVEYNQAPAAPVVTANDLYAKDYAARPAGQQAATGPAQAMSLTCDNCHRQFQAPSNCAGATCPVCGAVKVLR